MTQTVPAAGPAVRPPAPHRGWALASLATAQLMLAVDGTIMNIALPSAQRDLGLSTSQVQWVVTSYALAFAGLLLLGGRVSDLLGRRRGLLIGLGGFAAASILGGLATTPEVLLTARVLLGVFGALMTPSALALLSTTFPTPAERARAFGIFGTIMGAGAGVGVLLGGVLTDAFSWRAALWVNLPIAAFSAAGAWFAVRPVPRTPGVRLDVLGAVLATTGLVGLVYGLSRATLDGWTSGSATFPGLAGIVLIAAFLAWQRRATSPLLPLRVLRDRRRAAAFLALMSWGFALLVSFLFTSFFLQQVLGWSPLETAFGFLPYSLTIVVGVRVVTRLMARRPLPAIAGPGLVCIAAALALFGRLDVDGGYATHVLPIFLLLGLGTTLTLPVSNSTATFEAGPDTAVAGATGMTAQQIGFSLGPAVLGAVAAAATTSSTATTSGTATAAGPAAPLEAVVHGYAVAGPIGAGVVLVAALVLVALHGGVRVTSVKR